MNIPLYPKLRGYAKQLHKHGVGYYPHTDFLDVVPAVRGIQDNEVLFTAVETSHPAIMFLRVYGGDTLVGVRFVAAAMLAAYYPCGLSVLYPPTHVFGYLSRSEQYLLERSLPKTQVTAGESVMAWAAMTLQTNNISLVPPEVAEEVERRTSEFAAHALSMPHPS